MKPNLSWPGVPNRYSFSVGSMVRHPKSMATVVVVLSGVCVRSSTPAATSVIGASVVSGRISEIAPTAVVFPTPKPPAMTSLTGSGGCSTAVAECALSVGDGTETIDDPSQYGDVLGCPGVRDVDGQVVGRAQILGQHADDVEVQLQPGGEFGHRLRPSAGGDDVVVFEG